MDVLRTAVVLPRGLDPTEDDTVARGELAKSIDLMAKLPTIVAFEQRRRRGEKRHRPEPEPHLLRELLLDVLRRGSRAEVVRCFEISMILYAEHSFNASTFAAG